MKKLEFQLYTEDDNQVFFQLRVNNGRIFLKSDGYSTRAECENGITIVKENAIYDERYKRSQTPQGKYRFELLDDTGKAIGSSDDYPTRQSRDKAIYTVKTSAPNAQVSSTMITSSSVPHKSTDYVEIVKRKARANPWLASAILIAIAVVGISTFLTAVQNISTSASTYYDRLFRRPTDFSIQGNIVEVGSTQLPTDIVVKILWLIEYDSFDEKGDLIKILDFVQSPEISRIDPTSGSLGYDLILRGLPPQVALEHPPRNIGVATGIIIAFQDTEGDGSFSSGIDKMIALPPSLGNSMNPMRQFLFYLPREPADLLRDSQKGQISEEFLKLRKGYNIATVDPKFMEDGFRLRDVESHAPVSLDLMTSKGIVTLLKGFTLDSE